MSADSSRPISVKAPVETVARAAFACLDAMRDLAPPALVERLSKAKTTLERKESAVVVAGLFKAGKSTLINRIARWDILPSGDLPETGAPAILRKGRRRNVRVADRSGAQREITAAAEEVARQTSLYARDGQRRDSVDLASRVDIEAPKLRLPKGMSLIDLPGLRDTAEMDAVALDIAMEADLILWVFRSEPAFSEQDAEFLAFLVSVCGPHAVQLVLNVINRGEAPEAFWKSFQGGPLASHRTALRKQAPEIGLTQGHVDALVVVDASRMKKPLFGHGYGGRQFFKTLATASGRSAAQVKRARYVRMALAVEACRGWLAPTLAQVQTDYDAAEAKWNTYQARLSHRKALSERAAKASDAALSGLSSELSKAADTAASRLTRTNFKPALDITSWFSEPAATIVAARASGLVASLTSLCSDAEALPIATETSDDVIAAFAESPSGGDAIVALKAAIEGQVNDISTPKPKWSFGRVASFFKGEDKGVEEAISDTRSSFSSAARALSRSVEARQSKVKQAAASAVRLKPIDVVERPNPADLNRLRAIDAKLTALENCLCGVGGCIWAEFESSSPSKP